MCRPLGIPTILLLLLLLIQWMDRSRRKNRLDTNRIVIEVGSRGCQKISFVERVHFRNIYFRHDKINNI